LSYFFNLTSGATIILVAGVAYLLSLLWKNSGFLSQKKEG